MTDAASTPAAAAPDARPTRFAAFADVARVRLAPVEARARLGWAYAQSYAVDPPRLGLGTLAVLLAAGALAVWLYGRHAAAERDRHWRGAVAEGSAEVREILATHGRRIADLDERLVGQVRQGETDDETAFAERARQRGLVPLSDACSACRRPNSRLRQ